MEVVTPTSTYYSYHLDLESPFFGVILLFCYFVFLERFRALFFTGNSADARAAYSIAHRLCCLNEA